MNCGVPDETATIVVDYVMITLAFFCLITTIYGTHKYLQFWRFRDNDSIPASLFWSGLLFFIISSFTLINALLYDILYLVCSNLDKYEGPIYHSVYFMQIYSLWMVLFLRIYYVFKNSHFGLNKYIIIAYRISFTLIIIIIIPIYVLFGLQTDSVITVPFVALSIIFCTSLVIIFVYKLSQLFTRFGIGDQSLLNAMAKNVLLAVLSLSCTLIVFIVLISLQIVHKGHYEKHTVLEELILEFFILSDIISNFVCILLSYSFFNKQYNKFCSTLHEKFVSFFAKRLSQRISIKNKSESTMTSEFRRNKTLDTNQINGGKHTPMTPMTAMHSVALTINDGNNDKMVETELISTKLKVIHSCPAPIMSDINLLDFANSDNKNDDNDVQPLRSIHSAPARLNNN